MGISYQNLDDDTRQFMILELQEDLNNQALYISSRLTEEGKSRWPQLLQEALESHNDDWLASKVEGILSTYEKRKDQEVRIPVTAAETLAEGEFNKFYMRGICAFVLQNNGNGSQVEVYRGKDVQNPRPQSEALIGSRQDAASLLDALRTSPHVDTALGLPGGPNSGLTIKIV